MKFHATVVFEFNAHDVGEAGERLNGVLEHAGEAGLTTKSLELATPPGTPVTLPAPQLQGRSGQVSGRPSRHDGIGA